LTRIANENGDRGKISEIRELQKKEMKRHADFMRNHKPKKAKQGPSQPEAKGQEEDEK
jgi:hypothetical protein